MKELGKVGLKLSIDTTQFDEALKRTVAAVAELRAAFEDLDRAKISIGIDDVTEDVGN